MEMGDGYEAAAQLLSTFSRRATLAVNIAIFEFAMVAIAESLIIGIALS